MARTGKKLQKKEALSRIGVLFAEAQKVHKKDPALADKYVKLARSLQTKMKVRMPQEVKYKFCKKCGSFWMPGKTVRIRTHNGKLVFACLKCKAMRRLPYNK